MQSKEHWEKVYTTKAPDNVSWFQPHAEVSMRLVHATGLGLSLIHISEPTRPY